MVRVQSPTPSLEQELREQGEDSFDEEHEDLSSNDEDKRSSDENTDSEQDDSENEDDASDNAEEEELGDSAEEENAGGDFSRRKTGRGRQGRKPAAIRKSRQQKEAAPHLRLTVEQYLAPEQAKLFAAEILREYSQSELMRKTLYFNWIVF